MVIGIILLMPNCDGLSTGGQITHHSPPDTHGKHDGTRMQATQNMDTSWLHTTWSTQAQTTCTNHTPVLPDPRYFFAHHYVKIESARRLDPQDSPQEDAPNCNKSDHRPDGRTHGKRHDVCIMQLPATAPGSPISMRFSPVGSDTTICPTYCITDMTQEKYIVICETVQCRAKGHKSQYNIFLNEI